MSKTLRTVKNSTKVASVSRSKALTAAKNVKASRTKDTASAKSYSYKSAPSLVKK